MKNKVGSALLALLAAACLIVPCVSWMLSAFGLPYRSLLGDEGWRWLFMYGVTSMSNYWVVLLVWLFAAIGAVQASGLSNLREKKNRNALWACIGVVLVFVAVLLYFASYSQSPLLSITGGLQHSPFVLGLPCSMCLGIILTSLVYGIFSGTVRGLQALGRLLTKGISQNVVWIVCAMLFSFLYKCVQFCILID